jgi:hypothetical protein
VVDENWREGRFKIAKQTGRYAHFASVALRARPATTDDVSIAPDVRAQIWRTAIASGVQEALEKLRAMGALGCAGASSSTGLTRSKLDRAMIGSRRAVRAACRHDPRQLDSAPFQNRANLIRR